MYVNCIIFLLLPGLHQIVTLEASQFFALIIRIVIVFIFQASSIADQRGCGIRGQYPMGIGGHVITGVDTLLLLHLEGRQVDWQSRLLHLPLPIRAAYYSPDPRHYITRSNGGHSVLYQSKPI